MIDRRGFLNSILAPALAEGATRATSMSPPLASPAMPAWPEDDDPDFWDRIRDQFYIPRTESFFNTGTIGAVQAGYRPACPASSQADEKLSTVVILSEAKNLCCSFQTTARCFAESTLSVE